MTVSSTDAQVPALDDELDRALANQRALEARAAIPAHIESRLRFDDALVEVLGFLVRSRDEDELTIRQAAVLVVVATLQENWSVKPLAERFGVRKPSITRALQELQRRGLVTVARREGDRDRRKVDITVTTEGLLFVASLRGVMRDAALARRRGTLAAPAAPSP